MFFVLLFHDEILLPRIGLFSGFFLISRYLSEAHYVMWDAAIERVRETAEDW